MAKATFLAVVLIAFASVASACRDARSLVPTPTAPTPRGLMVTGEILLIGPDYQTDFMACLDDLRLGTWVGHEHGDNGWGQILLNDRRWAGNGRVEAGPHELALIIGSPFLNWPRDYRTERPSVVNVVEAETGIMLDSRNIAGRSATTRGMEAFGWIISIDANGRIAGLNETMLTTEELLSRHHVCLYGN